MCRMIISGRAPERGGNKPHSEMCRSRVEKLLQESPDGDARLKRYRDRTDDEVARRAEQIVRGQQEDEEELRKRPRMGTSSSGGASSSSGVSPSVQGGGDGGPSGHKRPAPAESEEPRPKHPQVEAAEGDPDMFGEDAAKEMDINSAAQGLQQLLMELSLIERSMREDFAWPTIDTVQDDLCEPKSGELRRDELALEYWDEVTGTPSSLPGPSRRSSRGSAT